MKRLVIVITLLLLTIFSVTAVYVYSQYRQLLPCLPPSLSTLDGCLSELPKIEKYLKLADTLKINPLSAQTLHSLDQIKPFIKYKDYLLGLNKPTTYLVLLQNDTEIKTNGGFFGSYAVITTDKGHLTTRFQDIYVPDGQLQGHVDPPAPIQTAFKTGAFKLRDSDWDPDFPHTATAIRWFMSKGKEIDPDNLITLSLTDIKDIIKIVGDFPVLEYNTTVTPDNIYALLQNQAELNFFPGSTQKKDALTATGRALINRINLLPWDKKIKIAQLIIDDLNQQNILINSKNSDLQQTLTASGWAGDLSPVPCTTSNCLSDTFALIQANMGANKANCCTTSETKHIIRQEKESISHKVHLTFNNASPKENGDPPRFYGGNYISYLRFYLPKEAIDIQVSALPTLPQTLLDYPIPYSTSSGQLDQTERYGFKEIGFFHITKALTQTYVELNYHLPTNSDQHYELHLLKQHGLHTSPQVIDLFGKTYQTNLTSDTSYPQ